MARINLHIEEIVLEGLKPGDKSALASAVQAELARLFSDDGIPQDFGRDVEIDRIDGGEFDAPWHMSGEKMGIKIARSVYRGLMR